MAIYATLNMATIKTVVALSSQLVIRINNAAKLKELLLLKWNWMILQQY